MFDCELLSRTCGVLPGGEFESEDDMTMGVKAVVEVVGKRKRRLGCWSLDLAVEVFRVS